MHDPFAIAELEHHLKRVKFNGEPSSDSNSINDQVWIRRAISPQNYSTESSDKNPWIYEHPLPERQRSIERHRPIMGISALRVRNGSAQSIERDKLRDDLNRHINTWPEIRANR